MSQDIEEPHVLDSALPGFLNSLRRRSGDLGPLRCLKYVLEQPTYLAALGVDIARRCSAGSPSELRVLCLGGVGYSAVVASRSCGPAARIWSVAPPCLQSHQWQSKLMQRVTSANGAVQVQHASGVPEEAWDVAVVEGLDTFVLADGALQLLRAALAFAAPGAQLVPGAARVRAVLCSARGFDAVSGAELGHFDLSALCGARQLAATASLLTMDEDNALLEGLGELSESFDAMVLWGPEGVSCHSSETRSIEVTCSTSGLCSAVLYWWETSHPQCRSNVKAVHWLPAPVNVQAGNTATLQVSRSLTRLKFSMAPAEQCTPRRHLPCMLSLRHCQMLRDTQRNEGYARAIRQVIAEMQVTSARADVFEIGSGSGLLMMMAQRAGASRVVGCEVDPQMCEMAAEVVAANGLEFGDLESAFSLLPQSFTEVVLCEELRGRFNILVAELLDDQGLGEQLWAFFALARRFLLSARASRLSPMLPGPVGSADVSVPSTPSSSAPAAGSADLRASASGVAHDSACPESLSAPIVLPRRLTVYAVLLKLEIGPLAGVNLWPLDPFWYCSTVPNLDSVARRSRCVSIDLDKYSDHWEPCSSVVKVMSIDLSNISLESVHKHQLDVCFPITRTGAVNSVAWFWHAELSDEVTLASAPLHFWNERGHSLPRTAVKGSRHSWKQASQVVGPIWVVAGEVATLRLVHDTVSYDWSHSYADQHQASAACSALHNMWETDRHLNAAKLLDLHELVQAWLGSLQESEVEASRFAATLPTGCDLLSDCLQEICNLDEQDIHPSIANFAVPLLAGTLTAGVFAPQS